MVTVFLTTATISSASKFTIPCYINPNNSRNLPFPLRQQKKFVIFAAKDDNKLGNWGQIELKLGKLIGENPELALAKIKDRKLEHHEGKTPKEVVAKDPNTCRHPNVILWKANTFKEDGLGTNMASNLSFKPNLSLKTGKEDDKERFSDMILVRNPEPVMKNDEVHSTNDIIKESTYQTEKDVSIQQKCESNLDQAFGAFNQSRSDDTDDTDNSSRNHGITFHTRHVAVAFDLDPSQEISGNVADDSVPKVSSDATLQSPPKRLDQSVKEMSNIGGKITRIKNRIPNAGTSENLPSIPFSKECEDMDWKRAEDMIKTTGRGVVELINCSTRGFIVSFGSLIGFLPYRNLATKWKFLAFESWLRRKGLDPSTYRKSLGVIGNYDDTDKTETLDETIDSEKIEGEISPDMKLEDLLTIYDQEKLEYLSTFVGQKIKVNVILADRESRKLIFSVKPKEKEESIQRKRNLMAKLNVGDIVTCCIKKISYFGIFVEVEGVAAMIHQTEVSWDATLNPSFKIGQVLKAKVHQLDLLLERIYLSLKEITPDPLTKSLEAILHHHAHATLDCKLEADQPQPEHEQYQGIELVTKGRFFFSPGLTPTFQVYMASMFKDQYKLLARAGDKVQEVVVQTWLGTEEMKHAILMCTKRNSSTVVYQEKAIFVTPSGVLAKFCQGCGYPAVNSSYYDLSFHPVS
ncbi:unnamed protein product [Lactuca saligna]|uniref:S1 motif domain-containing protein n=1 Tax=Lactuca saligna TaxID=75948 RepID=A0AA35Y7G7_LACSI|nr:unnamed protein product [Lactuca saligna]